MLVEEILAKVIQHSNVCLTPDSFSYLLPTQKTDQLYEGNIILLAHHSDDLDPFHPYI